MANNKISVDSVYQKVLALANKEQRGYITPQEFNLHASQAQLEIFENYFHDLRTAQLKAKNQTEASDEIEMLNERMSIHRVDDPANYSTSTGEYSISSDAYALACVTVDEIEADRVDSRDVRLMERNPLTKPTSARPVYVRTAPNKIKLYPTLVPFRQIKLTVPNSTSLDDGDFIILNTNDSTNGDNTGIIRFIYTDDSSVVDGVIPTSTDANPRFFIDIGSQSNSGTQVAAKTATVINDAQGFKATSDGDVITIDYEFKPPNYDDEGAFDHNPGSSLLASTFSRVIVRDGIGGNSSSNINIEYFKKPTNPNWGYVVIQRQALYNANTAVDFDLHESEENNLVMRILELSAITLQDPQLNQVAMRDKANTKAENNN